MALSPRGVLRPSGHIGCHADEAVVVGFLSDEVDGWMVGWLDGFREVWESVSTIVIITREDTSAFSAPCLG